MIAYSLLFEASPGRAHELRQGLQESLALWRGEPGFVDLLIISGPADNAVEALSFWRAAEDATRFAEGGGARLRRDLRRLLASASSSIQRRLTGSTNRMLVPEVPVDSKIPDSKPPQQAWSPAQIMAQGMKTPTSMFVTGLETALQISRRMQTTYATSVDRMLQPVSSQRPLAQPGAQARPSKTPELKKETDVTRDALSALIAFVVPGPDAYSIAQGVSTPEPGGLDAGVLDAMIAALDHSQPSKPGAPPASAVAAGGLNAVAQKVNPTAAGNFVSPFARLSFAEKAAVFQVVEASPETQALAGLLPLTAFLTYSEVGVFDRTTRALVARPVGWQISSYEGVANGWDDFKGYYEDRCTAEPSEYEAVPDESDFAGSKGGSK